MHEIVLLALGFAQIGITAFGGGLSMLALIEYQLVTKYGWMSKEAFNRLVAVSQVTPGPIAINAATFAGYEKLGVLGSAVATISLVLAPIILLIIVSLILRRVTPENNKKFKTMLRPIVAGLLTLSLVSPLTATVKNGVIAIILLIFGIVLLKKVPFFKNNPAAMLILFGIFGAFALR